MLPPHGATPPTILKHYISLANRETERGIYMKLLLDTKFHKRKDQQIGGWGANR